MVIWVATEFRDEHRQALDWLNQRTDSDTDFFGVVVEVIQIGNSLPAPQFRIVANPNEWQKSKRRKVDGETSERGEQYRQYFQELIDELREQYHFTGARKAQAQNWYTFSSGHKAFAYSHSFARGGRVRTEVYIDNNLSDREGNKAVFDQFWEDREAIEAELGYSLEWERMDDKNASRIAVYRQGSIDDDVSELENIRQWAVQELLRFKEVFGRRI